MNKEAISDAGVAQIARARFGWAEAGGLVALVGLAVWFLALSWRKWPDPLIDFGMELYTPWRLANGAVLYRDVDNFYGPLSKYFNALLFTLFKPGMMVLVAANLMVFAAIVATIYLLLRQAWGVSAALTAAAVFIVVFGFSQFVGIGNYNYATPYSHEATHGLLLCLTLTIVLVKWVKEPTLFRSFLAGILFGLAALLKSEILFTAGVVTGVAAFAACRHWRRPSAAATAMWAIGGLLPTAGFTAYFSFFLPYKEALSAACRGWLNVVATTRFTSVGRQVEFLGLDEPWTHFEQHAVATLAACLLLGVIVGTAWLSERIRHRFLWAILATALAGAMAWLACLIINWTQIGRCLFGIVLLYLLGSVAITVLRRNTAEESCYLQFTRWLIAILAAAMMARMILNGRIYQFGFYQAALASILVPAVLIGELPRRLNLGRRGQVVMLIGSIALLLPGIVTLARQSVDMLRIKTLAVGEGADRFYAFPERIEPTGKTVEAIYETLRHEPDSRTLLVLPEGAMINYLNRLPSTVAPFVFFSSTTEGGREAQIVLQLERNPPDSVVIVSRDLREYGIQRYGERPGSGEMILRWVGENYSQPIYLSSDGELGAIIVKHR